MMQRFLVLACVLFFLPGGFVTGQEPSTLEFAMTAPGARSLGFGGAFVALADDATAAYSNPAGLVQLIRPEISLELRNWNSGEGNETGIFSGFGFISYVHPRNRWTFAAYAHQVADMDFGWDSSIGSSPGTFHTADAVLLTSLSVLNLGISAAVAVNEQLSVGFGATQTVGDLNSWGLPWFSGDGTVESTRFDDRTSETGLIAGMNWSVAPQWVLGASFRTGVELLFDRAVDKGSSRVGGVSYPGVLAIGAAHTSIDGKLIASFEWDRLLSSVIEDRNQVRLGIEYVLLDSKPVFGIRSGLWRDEGVSLGHRSLTSGPIPVGSDEIHFSIGCGVAFKKFQLDVALDLADAGDTGSLSMIYAF
jgi:hypothetical protein